MSRNMSDEEQIVHRLKRDTRFEEPRWSISTMLNAFGMGLYAKTCCKRIVEAELVDMKHVFLDLIHKGDVWIDKVGFIKCEDIILSYLQKEDCDLLEDHFYHVSSLHRDYNQQLRYLKQCSRKELKDQLRKIKGITPTDEYQKASNEMKEVMEKCVKNLTLYIETELKCRKLTHKCWMAAQVLKDKCEVLWFDIKNYPLIKKLRADIEDIVPEVNSTMDIQTKRKRRYAQIYKKYQNKPLLLMSHREILKFVHIAVKHVRSLGISVDQREDEKFVQRWQKEFDKIFSAIGRLNLDELQQMFPVTKDFSRDPSWKNYFNVMDSLKNYKNGKSIGSSEAATAVLYEYLNDDIERFMTRWLMHANDMQYLFDKDPFQEMLDYQKRYALEEESV